MKFSKTIFTVLAVMLAAYVHAQQPLDAPVPKSTIILITLDSITPDAAYVKLANLLMDEGYTLAKTDKDLHLITTDWKDKGGFWRFELMLNISIREAPAGGCQVRLSGHARTENLTRDTQAMLGGQYNDMEIQKRTAGGKYWQELERVALLLDGQYAFL